MSSERTNFRGLAWYPVLAVGLSMMSFIVLKTGRDAVFFGSHGLQRLPLVYIWTAVAMVPAATFHLRAMRRWGARRARTGVCLVSALAFLAFAPWVGPEHQLAVSALFVVAPVLYAALFAGAWLLAGDLLEEADRDTTRWAYSFIGVGSMLGGILGGLFAKALAALIPASGLVAVAAALLAVVAGLCSLAHRRHPSPAEARARDAGAGAVLEAANEPVQPSLLSQRFVQALIGISVLSSIIGQYIDFQFYAIATVTGKSGMQFFANFYIVLNFCSLVLQLFVAPRLQARFGIGGALMVLPLALLGGAGVVTFTTTVFSRSILKVTEGGLKSSVFRSIWEQVFLGIDKAQRSLAKMLIDGLFARIAEGVGAIGLYVWILRNPTMGDKSGSLSWISWLILALCLFWVYLTRYLRRLGCSVAAADMTHLIRLPDS